MSAPVPSQGGNPGPAHPAWLAMRAKAIAERQRTLSRLVRVDPGLVAAVLQEAAGMDPHADAIAEFRAQLDDDSAVTAWLAPGSSRPSNPIESPEEEK